MKKNQSQKQKFPVTMEFVEQACSDVIGVGEVNGDEVTHTCFNCGRQTLSVNRAKSGGIYHCPACGVSGNRVKLWMNVRGFDNEEEAMKSLVKQWNSLNEGERCVLSENAEKQSTPQRKLIPIEYRDMIYRAMIKNLTLNATDRRDCYRRGLSDEAIERLHIVSFPQVGLDYIAEYALLESGMLVLPLEMPRAEKLMKYKEFLIDRNFGIPGFWYDETPGQEGWKLHRSWPGYLIPICDKDGRISYFQVRPRIPTKSAEKGVKVGKYINFTSRKDQNGCGTSGAENIHFTFAVPYGTDTAPEAVYITEGELKADVAAYLSDKPFIALVGVNVIAQLPETLKMLKDRGTREIRICVDMDYREKKEVSQALDNIKKCCEDCGVVWKALTWNDEYKGIDDYILAKKIRTGYVLPQPKF